MAQRIKVTNNQGTYWAAVVCFGGLHCMVHVPIKNLYYNIKTTGKDVRKEALLLRRHLVPALGLDKNRVTIHKTSPDELDVTVKSKGGDSMWDVFILTSIFRNFHDNTSMAYVLGRLIRKGMDPVVAMSVSSRLGYHPRLKKYYDNMAGSHALLNDNPVINYYVLNEWIRGEVESNTLGTTGSFGYYPRPSPRIDSRKDRADNLLRSRLIHMGSIVNRLNGGDYDLVEETIKEGVQ